MLLAICSQNYIGMHMPAMYVERHIWSLENGQRHYNSFRLCLSSTKHRVIGYENYA